MDKDDNVRKALLRAAQERLTEEICEADPDEGVPAADVASAPMVRPSLQDKMAQAMISAIQAERSTARGVAHGKTLLLPIHLYDDELP